MSDLLDLVVSYDPVVSGVSVALNANVTLILEGVNSLYDTDTLEEGFFLTTQTGDQYVGEGLLPLEYPEGIPYEDLRDIFDTDSEATTIVESTVTVTEVDGNTVLTLNPRYPLKASIEYRANLTDVLEDDGTAIDGYISWPFTTGTGSIEEPPEDISTSILSVTVQNNMLLTASPLSVVRTVPLNHAVQQSVDLDQIEIEFNKTIDSNYVNSNNIIVEGLPATDHPAVSMTCSGIIETTLNTVGKVLLINDISDEIFMNNIIKVTVTSGLRATDGTSLAEEYEMEYMTVTSPTYSTVRKVRLTVGGFIRDLEDDVIQQSILESSLEADELDFSLGKTNNSLFEHARREYVTCLAASTLLHNLGNYLLKSKSLDNLRTDYDTSGIQKMLNKTINCLERWEPQLISGGGAKAIRSPTYVIKGEYDPDRPSIGRSWLSTEDGTISRRIPMANSRSQDTDKRRSVASYRKRYW